MLGYDHSRASPDEVQRDLGELVTDTLFELDIRWHGPVASSYGLHLVHVVERVEGHMPDYGETRDKLVMDYSSTRRDRAKKALCEDLARRCEISIGDEAIRASALDQP